MLKRNPFFLTLICWCGYGLWAWLVDLQKWVISSCLPLIKQETFNNLCEIFYFVIEFELEEDRDLMDSDWVLGFGEAMVYG